MDGDQVGQLEACLETGERGWGSRGTPDFLPGRARALHTDTNALSAIFIPMSDVKVVPQPNLCQPQL